MSEIDRILILEDNPADAELAVRTLEHAGHSFEHVRVETRDDFLEQLETFHPDLILADYVLPSFSGMAALGLVRERDPAVPVVMYTGSINEETAVECIKAGASDYVLKSHEGRLAPAVEAAYERAKEREAREWAEARYEHIVENATFGIYTSSPAGEFLSVNRAMVEMLGYESREELLRANMEREICADPSQRKRVLQGFLVEGQRVFEEVKWKRKDGDQIIVRLNGRAVHNSAGELQFFEAIAEDVSERRTLEAQLRQAQKMEAVGQLTGGIAHDFNNELSVILLNTQMLSDRLNRGGVVGPDDLRDISDAAERATEMTRQLVGFSRRAALSLAPTDLASRVRKMSAMLNRLLPETIAVETVADDPVAAVLVDPHSLEQMLLNLVTNARHAMPDGGSLTVSVEEKDLDEEYCERNPPTPPGRYVVVSVTDTGTGMDEETREKIFEPFFTTKPVGEGTGLGMAMVYGLTKQQNGFVHVESEPGRGTTVRLAFPTVPDAAETAEHEVVSADTGGKENILLVEDEEALRRAGRRVLESRGYSVVTAGDGVEALETFRSGEHRFDLVISDLVMPKMGGAELCATIRAEDGDIPLLVASGHSDDDVRAQMEALENVPVIQKPWTVSEMLRAVRKVLDDARAENV